MPLVPAGQTVALPIWCLRSGVSRNLQQLQLDWSVPRSSAKLPSIRVYTAPHSHCRRLATKMHPWCSSGKAGHGFASDNISWVQISA